VTLSAGNGQCELVVSGGNFDRGVLTHVAVGGQSISVDSCKHTCVQCLFCVRLRHLMRDLRCSASELRCAAIPAGRGTDLALDLAFSNHVASDMTFDVHVDNALSYADARIHEVALAGERVQIKGANFGPVGALGDDVLKFDDAPCTDARVDEHDALASCKVARVCNNDMSKMRLCVAGCAYAGETQQSSRRWRRR
jgi:hypothetical protein